MTHLHCLTAAPQINFSRTPVRSKSYTFQLYIVDSPHSYLYRRHTHFLSISADLSTRGYGSDPGLFQPHPTLSIWDPSPCSLGGGGHHYSWSVRFSPRPLTLPPSLEPSSVHRRHLIPWPFQTSITTPLPTPAFAQAHYTGPLGLGGKLGALSSTPLSLLHLSFPQTNRMNFGLFDLLSLPLSTVRFFVLYIY